MPRNPSELARLEEERDEILRMLASNRIPPTSSYADKGLKSAKTALVKDLWDIEKQLGIKSIEYNSTEFVRLLDEYRK